jgi:hypothetical protein
VSRLRNWRLIVFVAVSAAMAIAVSSAPAAAAPPALTGVPLTFPKSVTQPKPLHLAASEQADVKRTCAASRAAAASRGQKYAACVGFSSTKPPKSKATDSMAVTVGTECTQYDGRWSILDRFRACDSGWAYYYVLDLEGNVYATAAFSGEQEIEMFEGAPIWDEDMFITLYYLDDPFGFLDGLSIDVQSTCSWPCTQTDSSAFGGSQYIDLGETLEGDWERYDDPSPGPDSMDLSYTWNVDTYLFGTVAFSYDLPTSVRCDALVGGYRGCVFPVFLPVFAISVSQFQEAAVAINWAQRTLPDQWGYDGSPLSRLANDTLALANRRAICEDGSFVKDPAVTNDSCDEWPFARSRESGAMLGIAGADCAEVEPIKQDGQWIIQPIRKPLTYDERCMRAHVPLNLNEGVGGALGYFTQNFRLLDYDQYYVQVVQ